MADSAQKDLMPLKTKLRVFDDRASYVRKYQDVAIGNRSILSLLKYELTITMLSWLPGAIGIFLRKYFYARLFRPKLRNVIFGKHVDIFSPNKIKIGKNCLIGDNCLLEAKQDAIISIGDNVSIGRGALIRCGMGSIQIGDDSAIAAYCNIAAFGTNVKIGKHAAIAAYSYVNGALGYDFNTLKGPMAHYPRIGKGITIEDNVWLGAGVKVIDGNNIGTGSVIGAGSVVTRNIPPYSTAVGVPAEIIKERVARPQRSSA